jgi:hypothetical protein
MAATIVVCGVPSLDAARDALLLLCCHERPWHIVMAMTVAVDDSTKPALETLEWYTVDSSWTPGMIALQYAVDKYDAPWGPTVFVGPVLSKDTVAWVTDALSAVSSNAECVFYSRTSSTWRAESEFETWLSSCLGYQPHMDDEQYVSNQSACAEYFFGVFMPGAASVHIRPKHLLERVLCSEDASRFVDRALPLLLNPLPRVVWMLWLQGWDTAPALVHAVAKSWRTLNPGWAVRCLDRTNLPDNLGVTGKDWQDASQPGCAAFSDRIRLALLAIHGGVWADATMLCMQPLDAWVADAVRQSGMWMYHGNPDGRGPASWFLVARTESYLMTTWHRASLAYWAGGRTKAHDYFWMDGLFFGRLHDTVEFRAAWASVPKLNCARPGSAAALPGKEFATTPAIIAVIQSHVPYAFKLSWRSGVYIPGDSCNAARLIDWVLSNQAPVVVHPWEPAP